MLLDLCVCVCGARVLCCPFVGASAFPDAVYSNVYSSVASLTGSLLNANEVVGADQCLGDSGSAATCSGAFAECMAATADLPSGATDLSELVASWKPGCSECAKSCMDSPTETDCEICVYSCGCSDHWTGLCMGTAGFGGGGSNSGGVRLLAWFRL